MAGAQNCGRVPFFPDPPTALSIDLAKLFLEVLEESNAITDRV